LNNNEKLFKKILVALDGSSYSNQVAKYGADIALRYNAEITLIYVVELPKSVIPIPGMDIDFSAEIELTGKLAKRMESKAQILLNEYRKDMEGKGLDVKIRIENGNASDIILTIAEDENYDLIVVGSRGLGNVKRFILGSVSDKISKHAHCPVLIVH
jgi:nucleotide-binding universal stress UspA family protein